jgi:3-hydroxyisobutyrate dehydrogenase-like beta-hydroxyacid dehydrogenase
MGGGIARNFHKSGVSLAVWDIVPAVCRAFEGLAGALDTKVPLGTVTRDILDAAITQGMTDTDFSRLYKRFDEIVATVGNTESSG